MDLLHVLLTQRWLAMLGKLSMVLQADLLQARSSENHSAERSFAEDNQG